MRIDNWPLDRIMRLPDWCFGRRWWVGAYMGSSTGVAYSAMCEEAFPDKFVVWSVMINSRQPTVSQALRITFRLADNLAAFNANPGGYDRLLKGVSSPLIVFEFFCAPNCSTYVHDLRHIVESSGRRLCIHSNGDQENAYEVTAAVLISAMPKEIPDWLILGRE